MQKRWTSENLLAAARSYQFACTLFAAAELNIFTVVSKKPTTAPAIARKIKANARATQVILDALVALELLTKRQDRYFAQPDIADLLTETSHESVLAMVRHQANCLRRWVQLARTAKTGKPPKRIASIRGFAADEEAFIGAMDNVSGPIAKEIVSSLKSLRFKHLLDIGGASGTWTIAFLRAFSNATATLFDLPQVIPMAKQRIKKAALTRRVKFVKGDFYKDPLPKRADFAWLSAIAHQNSRKQNRRLFSKISKALDRGGVLVIRDIVMDASRTSPQAGALFAINMLVATEGGGTYTFSEFKEDLAAAGFSKISLLHKDEGMTSLIYAEK
jgi:predicted O-methyltransferase YrrM